MPPTDSPLRYPGGKQILKKVVAHLIKINDREAGVYAEPYAGGAGLALGLLYSEHVDRILINDVDPCVYAFWKSCLYQTKRFVDMIWAAPITVEEWRRQRDIYLHPHRHSTVRVGFATFFLNRCNRSGIIATGGPIGGIEQHGEWKINARYNRENLERRIRKLALYKDRIHVSSLDALDFLGGYVREMSNVFVYLDPPYYNKARDLYLNHYSPDDHRRVAKFMKREAEFKWVMTYDNTPEIAGLYRGLRQVPFDLSYSARERRQGKEVMISRRSFRFPRGWGRAIPQEYITAADGVEIPG